MVKKVNAPKKATDIMSVDELLSEADKVLDNVDDMYNKCDITNLQDNIISWHVIENELTSREKQMSTDQKTAYNDFMTDFNQYLLKTEDKCKCFLKFELVVSN